MKNYQTVCCRDVKQARRFSNADAFKMIQNQRIDIINRILAEDRVHVSVLRNDVAAIELFAVLLAQQFVSLPEYGHMDSIFGKNAVDDVYSV